MHFDQPAFGRIFSRLALTPATVTGVTTFAAVCAYLSVVDERSLSLVAMMAGGVALLLALNISPIAQIAACLCVLFTALLVHPFGSLGVWLGLGGALAAIAWARSFVARDHAFDNFDRLLAVCACALCSSALGASITLRGAVAVEPYPPVIDHSVPFSAIASVVIGLLAASVVVTGDLRRIRWLRGLRAGKAQGYALRSPIPNASEHELPALIGGLMPASSVLVMRQTLPSSAFRTGWREIAVARAPASLSAVSFGVWLRLSAVGLAAAVQLALLTAAVWSSFLS